MPGSGSNAIDFAVTGTIERADLLDPIVASGPALAMRAASRLCPSLAGSAGIAGRAR